MAFTKRTRLPTALTPRPPSPRLPDMAIAYRLHDLAHSPQEGSRLPAQGEWTYEDYLRLPDDGWRYEVLKGTLSMSPAPTPKHQGTLARLVFLVQTYLAAHPVGRVYFAPLDVLLPGGLATPVQPDLVFLRNERRNLVTERAIEGAPDLIAEVLSPSNWLTDRREKFEIYAEAGVLEYWILDPRGATVEVFTLQDGAYELVGSFDSADRVQSRVWAGFSPAVSEIFAD
jgi:Uma2 family endonuclease